MRAVVAEEAELGDHHAERGREQELKPGVAQQEDAGPDGGECGAGGQHARPVVGVAPTEQPTVPDLTGEVGVQAGEALAGTWSTRASGRVQHVRRRRGLIELQR